MNEELPPLSGLLLAGGRSTRMGGVDKAALTYAGEDQLSRAYRLLAAVAGQTHVSIGAAHAADRLRARFPCLLDEWPDAGPMGAVATAFRRWPQRAFLVLACDLPMLERGTLDALVAARDARHQGVLYADPATGFLEPLCAIYEPALGEAVIAAMEAGERSLQRVLVGLPIRTLVLPEGDALRNVNTPQERELALRRLAGGPQPPGSADGDD